MWLSQPISDLKHYWYSKSQTPSPSATVHWGQSLRNSDYRSSLSCPIYAKYPNASLGTTPTLFSWGNPTEQWSITYFYWLRSIIYLFLVRLHRARDGGYPALGKFYPWRGFGVWFSPSTTKYSQISTKSMLSSSTPWVYPPSPAAALTNCLLQWLSITELHSLRKLIRCLTKIAVIQMPQKHSIKIFWVCSSPHSQIRTETALTDTLRLIVKSAILGSQH